jgi:hypothetical protein
MVLNTTDKDSDSISPVESKLPEDLAVLGACFAFVAALVVFCFGVVVPSESYGSRVTWLLGLVLPLLALSEVASRLVCRSATRSGESQRAQLTRCLSIFSLVLLAIPFVLLGMLLFVYGSFFIFHSLGLTH